MISIANRVVRLAPDLLGVCLEHSIYVDGRVSNFASGMYLNADMTCGGTWSGYPGVGSLAAIESLGGYAISFAYIDGARRCTGVQRV